MNSAESFAETLKTALAVAVDAVRPALSPRDITALADDDLLSTLASVEGLGRLADALRVTVSAEIDERSRLTLCNERLSTRKGCRNAVDLIAKVTGVTESTAARWCRLGAGVRERDTITGELLPAKYPVVAEALCTGAIGLDTAGVIVSALGQVAHRAEPGLLSAAERGLVGSAIGVDPDTGAAGVPFTADQTRIHARQWRDALDPDGVEVRENQAMQGRGIVKLASRGGLEQYRLSLMPHIAGQLDRILDTGTAAKTTGRFLTDDERQRAESDGDDRTAAQRRHDAFAAALDAAARCGELPSMGGMPSPVLVSVDADTLQSGTGAGHVDGIDEPISLRSVKQLICTAGVQKGYFDSTGRLIALGSPERGFTPQQRRGIALRDGGCIITGCTIPAGWCEAHHVEEWSKGGPTHTDNGVLLCWFHHHTIDTSGWHVRVRDGVPEVMAPRWIDPDQNWTTASRSRARAAAARNQRRRQREQRQQRERRQQREQQEQRPARDRMSRADGPTRGGQLRT